MTNILTLSCKDTTGIVADVAGFLAKEKGFIIESAQFGDSSTGQFFMRTVFSAPDPARIRDNFAKVADKFAMQWNMYDTTRKERVMIMVSKHGHCLQDLLHRYSSGSLKVDIACVVSNHNDLRKIVELHNIPFYHLPITNKASQEKEVIKIIKDLKIGLVVLARYMQVLSPDFVDKIYGRAINIHHSFLPSFKGAKPYHQAFDRGVKIIGATAHYVSNALDEGPIIEQEVIRVTHAHTPEQLLVLGKDIECLVLARAVQYHIERKVILNGKKTVIL